MLPLYKEVILRSTPVSAAGGFNFGGASSSAAAPAVGQTLQASQGFGFGASGQCLCDLRCCLVHFVDTVLVSAGVFCSQTHIFG